MADLAELREWMVERQIAARGIADPRILAAFRAVPREVFVAAEYAGAAYGDCPLPIGGGQTISQPYIVALMIEAADVRPDDRVLEVGAGSGYAAAILGRLARDVVAIERQPALAELARSRIGSLGIANVAIVEGDGTLGWSEGAPYDAILVAASGHEVPPALIAQLAPGGRLVMPVGGPADVQRLIKASRQADGRVTISELGHVRFVPLIGAHGWDE